MLRIAVQSKGRLYEDTMALLKETGIKINNARRTLLVQSGNFPLEVLYMRDDDIPEFVASGIADIGIVGENEFVERGKDASIAKRLGFSKCRLSLAIPEEADYQGLEWFNGKKIATSYPNILRKFAQEHNLDIDIHVIQGSVEIAPGIGLSDCIFDIVSSGSTLVSNKLREVEVVMKSEALLICNKELTPEKQATLDEFLFRIQSVLVADNKKYVLMNAPTEKVGEICKILPGIKSPTILPLATEGWTSIHAVIDQNLHNFPIDADEARILEEQQQKARHDRHRHHGAADGFDLIAQHAAKQNCPRDQAKLNDNVPERGVCG